MLNIKKSTLILVVLFSTMTLQVPQAEAAFDFRFSFSNFLSRFSMKSTLPQEPVETLGKVTLHGTNIVNRLNERVAEIEIIAETLSKQEQNLIDNNKDSEQTQQSMETLRQKILDTKTELENASALIAEGKKTQSTSTVSIEDIQKSLKNADQSVRELNQIVTQTKKIIRSATLQGIEK